MLLEVKGRGPYTVFDIHVEWRLSVDSVTLWVGDDPNDSDPMMVRRILAQFAIPGPCEDSEIESRDNDRVEITIKAALAEEWQYTAPGISLILERGNDGYVWKIDIVPMATPPSEKDVPLALMSYSLELYDARREYRRFLKRMIERFGTKITIPDSRREQKVWLILKKTKRTWYP